MWKLIAEIALMLGLGGILYLIVRLLPRIDDAEHLKVSVRHHGLIHYLEKIDNRIKKHSEKFLRRLGVTLLKFENKINKKLSSYKKDSDQQ